MPNSVSLPEEQVLFPSSPLSRGSEDSNTSLRALEISEGADASNRPQRSRRSYSLSGFQFEHDLLPLSLSESIQNGREQISKNVGVIKGKRDFHLARCHDSKSSSGMALIIGLQGVASESLN
jgi:hypothetical protein